MIEDTEKVDFSSTVSKETELRLLKEQVLDCLQDAMSNNSVTPKRVSTVLDLGEEFGLVSRKGMETGLHFPLREKQYLSSEVPVDGHHAVQTLRHVLRQTQRAINIERRGGHSPRKEKQLYGRWNFLAEKLRYR